MRILVSVGYDPQCCQDFQVSETRRFWSAALIYLFWAVRKSKLSDLEHLQESPWEFPCPLAWFTWIAPEWLRRIRQYVCFSYLNKVVMFIPTAIFLSIIVQIERYIIRLAASVNFSTGVTIPVLFHSDERPTKTVIAFVVIGGILELSWGGQLEV